MNTASVSVDGVNTCFKGFKDGGTKTYYEVWEHGECRSSYAYDNSTGRKVEARQSMPELVAGIVRRECLSLEKIMFKGAYKFVF